MKSRWPQGLGKHGACSAGCILLAPLYKVIFFLNEIVCILGQELREDLLLFKSVRVLCRIDQNIYISFSFVILLSFTFMKIFDSYCVCSMCQRLFTLLPHLILPVRCVGTIICVPHMWKCCTDEIEGLRPHCVEPKLCCKGSAQVLSCLQLSAHVVIWNEDLSGSFQISSVS